ncbi:hypothetical protein GGX14DRAFT_655090 [Mycena pura]|uniref:F-box domain-containing protein n=1 Tax=Mycena pura TaxID=153505 RepID=A0AAD6Y539_9AGAR|nr:hypothetical protein GGX14DRAFT_655090 [Mycena pura]
MPPSTIDTGTTAAAGLRAQLAQIEESMAALESQLTSLRSEKHRLLEDLGRIVYPVITLPTEITSDIFLHIIPKIRPSHGDEDDNGGDADDDASGRLQGYHSLMRLASVCRTWRAVVLSTCALWNSITVFCDVVRDPIKLLEAWLPRAGKLPLDLEIRLPCKPRKFSTIISVLGQYSSQWRHVHFFAPPDLVWSKSLPIDRIDRFPSALPLLETLRLLDYHLSDGGNPGTSLRDAPGLHRLFLKMPSAVIRIFPLHQLTTLQFHTSTAAELLEVLVLTPNLKLLRLGMSRGEELAVLPSLTLPYLHTFQSIGDTLVLRYLTLPALTHLKFEYLTDSGLEALQACISQSSPTIRTLELSDGSFDVAHACFIALSTLRHVTLVCPDYSDKVSDFCDAMKTSSFLPNLESLKYDGCFADSAMHLADAISARYLGVEGTTKLTAVSLTFQEYGDLAEALPKLRDLGRRGLKLDIKGCPAGV